MTGVEGNSEIKIWTCETWSCLQTLRYAPDDDSSSSALKLKVAVDITANFILISDMQRKVIFLLFDEAVGFLKLLKCVTFVVVTSCSSVT